SVGRIIVAGCIAKERQITGSRVIAACCGGSECLITDCRVAIAGREAEEGVGTLGGVVVGIASIRWWINRPSLWRERQTSEREHDEKSRSRSAVARRAVR